MHHVHESSPARASARTPRWMPAAAGCLIVAAGLAFGAPVRAQSGGEAVYAVTYLDVSASWVVQGIGLLKEYREAGRKEAGNLEFSVLEELNRPNRFVVVEAWKDQAAFAAHGKSANASRFAFVLGAIQNSPPDRHMLQAFATAPAGSEPSSGALYMVEHVDFMGGDPAIAAAAQPLVKALAESSRKEEGVVRYEIYQQPSPRINHYEVVAVWKDAKAFDAHETAAHTRQFRAATVMSGPVARANLYDQRLYKAL